MSKLELRLLGTPSIKIDEQSVKGFNSNKTRALFYYLAATRKSFSRPLLAGLFWGELSDEKALTNLRKSLANLRKIVGDFVNISRQTVAFNRDSDYQIDVETIALLRGDGATINQLQTITSLYGGDFLAGFFLPDAPEFEQWMLGQRAKYREMILPAFHQLIHLLIQQNRNPDAINEARRFLQLEPWREETHQLLMTLYARTGQRSAALRQYKDCVDILWEELAIQPAEDTIALMERIRNISAPNHNLPTTSKPLLGREEELVQLKNLLLEPSTQLVTLVGAGGMGKTRLAIAAAAQMKLNFIEGVWFIDLAAIVDSNQLLLAIANGVNLKLDLNQTVLAQLQSFLSKRECLLILDNFEQLVEAAGALTELLKSAPNVKLLVTSRQQLRLSAEQIMVIDGLPVPMSPDPNNPAMQLFAEAVRQHQPSFSLDENLPEVFEICRLVYGAPLAIELAAASAHFLPCAHIAKVIAENLDNLQTELRDVPPRHRSVRAVFDHSWALLSEDERLALSKVSIFRGGFSLEAAEQVCATHPSTLARLVNHSLLRRTNPYRYESHELLRQYAKEQLSDFASVRQSHMSYYLHRIREYADRLHDDDALLVQESIQADWGNFKLAWEYACDSSNLNELEQSMPAFLDYLDYKGNLTEYAGIVEDALTLVEQWEKSDRKLPAAYLPLFSHALSSKAHAEVYLGQFDTAIATASRAVDILPEGDNEALAQRLISLIAVCFRCGQIEQMGSTLTRLDAEVPQIDNPILELRALNWRGIWHGCYERYDEAVTYFHHSLETAEEHGLQNHQTHAFLNLGTRFGQEGLYAEAEHYFLKALENAQRIGAWSPESTLQNHLALIDYYFNRTDSALQRLQSVIQLFKKMGNHFSFGQPYMFSGIVYQGAEQFEDAEENLRLGLRYYEAQGTKVWQAMTRCYMGINELALGRLEASAAQFEQAFELAKDVGSPSWMIRTKLEQVELCLQVGGKWLNATAALLLQDELFTAENMAKLRDKNLHALLASVRAGFHLQNEDVSKATNFAREALALSAELVPILRVYHVTRAAYCALAESNNEAAQTLWAEVFALRKELNHPNGEIEARAQLAHLAWQNGQKEVAGREFEEIWSSLIQKSRHPLAGAQNPLSVFSACHIYFSETQDQRLAALNLMIQAWFSKRTDKITDNQWRVYFWENAGILRGDWVIRANF